MKKKNYYSPHKSFIKKICKDLIISYILQVTKDEDDGSYRKPNLINKNKGKRKNQEIGI